MLFDKTMDSFGTGSKLLDLFRNSVLTPNFVFFFTFQFSTDLKVVMLQPCVFSKNNLFF